MEGIETIKVRPWGKFDWRDMKAEEYLRRIADGEMWFAMPRDGCAKK